MSGGEGRGVMLETLAPLAGGWREQGASGIFSPGVCVPSKPIARAAAGRRQKLHPCRDKPAQFPPARPALVSPAKQDAETNSYF